MWSQGDWWQSFSADYVILLIQVQLWMSHMEGHKATKTCPEDMDQDDEWVMKPCQCNKDTYQNIYAINAIMSGICFI